MKMWAQHSDDKHSLFQTVEVALSMCPNNAEEFHALEMLRDGARPEPAGLNNLRDIVDELVRPASWWR
jgi:hypothetical protein